MLFCLIFAQCSMNLGFEIFIWEVWAFIFFVTTTGSSLMLPMCKYNQTIAMVYCRSEQRQQVWGIVLPLPPEQLQALPVSLNTGKPYVWIHTGFHHFSGLTIPVRDSFLNFEPSTFISGTSKKLVMFTLTFNNPSLSSGGPKQFQALKQEWVSERIVPLFAQIHGAEVFQRWPW